MTQRHVHSLAAELAALVPDLHDLIGSYVPRWFTKETDVRIARTLADVDSVLRSRTQQ